MLGALDFTYSHCRFVNEVNAACDTDVMEFEDKSLPTIKLR